VPTLNVTGWFDQEDFNGPLKIYETLEKNDANNNKNFIVVGPWNHGGWAYDAGNKLDGINFQSATGRHFREKIQAPWFAYFLKDKGKLEQPEALMFQTGANKWLAHDQWPPKKAVTRNLYFQPGGKLSFEAPVETAVSHDDYRSDPNNPVPYRPRPVDGEAVCIDLGNR
jgi:putative CocE/NonD family hydrolase